MNSTTAAKLIALNREFYRRFGKSFSATRQRLQPGVKRILESLSGDENILDLGCGNGVLARALAKRGHRGSYLGLDFSLPLLQEAETPAGDFSAKFMQVDLTQLSEISDQLLAVNTQWDIVTAFAVLHHIPSEELRLNILEVVHQLLVKDGRFILSNWQFLNSEKLKARIKPWDATTVLKPALPAPVSPRPLDCPDDSPGQAGPDGTGQVQLSRVEASEVDAGDYLLDWRNGGEGLRYVHHFTAEELFHLAERTGFHVIESFLSDGEGGKLGLYQIWGRA